MTPPELAQFVQNRHIKTHPLQTLAAFTTAILMIVSSSTPSIAQKTTKKVGPAGSRIESSRLYDEQLKRASEGLPQEQFTLGLMFATGIGVRQDLKQAVYWYQRAAEAGHTDAQYNLGSVYLAGVDIEKDPHQAVAWWRKAAEAGHAAAQFTLGQTLTYGLGVEADQVEGIKWLERAAAQCNPRVVTFLSQIKPVLSTDTAAAPADRQAPPGGASDGQTQPVKAPDPADPAAHKNMQLAHASSPPVKIKLRAAGALTGKVEMQGPPPRGENDNAWLYAQEPDHYSLQLLSATSKVAAQRYIERQRLGDQAAFFYTRANGKDWYYVLYGSFATRAEAKAAGQRITKSARIRRFGVLQQKRCAGASQLPPQQSQEVTSFCASSE